MNTQATGKICLETTQQPEAVNDSLNKQSTTRQAFPHRFNADDALNPRAIGYTINSVSYRTRGMLNLVVDYLVDTASNEENAILGTLEAAIDSMNDLLEIAYIIESKAYELEDKTNQGGAA